jgi:hypothetical protein
VNGTPSNEYGSCFCLYSTSSSSYNCSYSWYCNESGPNYPKCGSTLFSCASGSLGSQSGSCNCAATNSSNSACKDFWTCSCSSTTCPSNGALCGNSDYSCTTGSPSNEGFDCYCSACQLFIRYKWYCMESACSSSTDMCKTGGTGLNETSDGLCI